MSYVFRPLMAAALIAFATPVLAQTADTATTKAPAMSAPAKMDKTAPAATAPATSTPAITEKKADAVAPKTDTKATDAKVKSSSTDTKMKVASNETGTTRHHHKMVKEEPKSGAKSDAKTETPATK